MKITYYVEVKENKKNNKVGGGCWAMCCTKHTRAGAQGIL